MPERPEADPTGHPAPHRLRDLRPVLDREPDGRAPRVTLTRIVRDSWRRVLELESDTVLTCVALVTRPGRVIRGYIAGERDPWANPVKLYLIVAALSVLLTRVILPDPTPEMLGGVRAGVATAAERPEPAGDAPPPDATRTGQASDPTPADPRVDADTIAGWTFEFQDWYIDALPIVSVLTTPALALATWGLFRRPRWNLAEHCVFVLYSGVPTYFATIAALPVYLAGYAPGITVTVTASTAVLAMIAWRTFDVRPIGAAWRTLLVLVAQLIVIYTVFIVLAIAYIAARLALAAPP